ncbi:Nuclear cap-binding protein subunit 1 [Mycena sanguinolenta]|uniref:Nuclear cap-binding protein subunit 1 n=1 Tax=Mycena sanguinolenta TaxID=230812 RepID=A0A8H6Y614_9AGAR|nr:Nuclear cap-binding protein subunit 1 [Mycena sanguinolenta]
MSSYHRGGGNRRRQHRDDYDDRRRDVYESPADKLKNAIIKFGDVDAVEELPLIEKQIREFTPVVISNLSEAFRIAVTEQPFKIPHYAALLRRLHDSTEDAPTDGPSLGKQILEDFWKGFQAYLDKLAWRETRLCIHFFAHLTVAKLISTDSMFALLQSFTAVLEEFGVSNGRAKKAAVCAAEGLMIGGPILKPSSAERVQEVINGIQAYNDSATSPKALTRPIVELYSDEISTPNADELLDTALQALRTLDESDFAETASSFLQPYATYPDLDLSTFTLYDLPSVLVPPEVIELDGLSTDSGEDAQVKKEEWPEYFLSLFENDITPDPKTPAGYTVRTGILDILDIFEVNRKECARLLIEYPKWTIPGTFKPKPGGSVNADPVPGRDWQLESTIIETILGASFVLPESCHKSIYYIGVITELCKLSPSTVGPAVGKSIRKLYSNLGEGLDVEVARRFAEWFAVHMSNFGFQWVWKEWIPDLALDIQHPKRAFMRRALEFEIRLSYHDRILKTLPAEMQAPEGHTIGEQAPGPDFEYDDPAKPYHDAAQSVLNLFRGRAEAKDVISHLETLKVTLETSDDGGIVNADALIRNIAIQSLLHIGSRSFSHLLNAIERYLALLRSIASGGASGAGGTGNAEAKADILTASAAFWKHNRHMVAIVFDKLMQYQIVDPTDVVGWTFINRAEIRELSESTGPLSLSAFEWDLLKGALDKANGRVMIARRKVATLRKEDDDNRARAKASGGADGNAMDVDADVKADDAPVDSPALTTALKAFASLTREQKGALSRTLDGFVSCLAPGATDSNPNPHSRVVISEEGWNDRASWEKDQWNAWETWGWYRQFCRSYAPYLRNYSTTLFTVSFAKFEGSTDPAAELLKKTWNVATGQE